jgi:hypothetical protein
MCRKVGIGNTKGAYRKRSFLGGSFRVSSGGLIRHGKKAAEINDH